MSEISGGSTRGKLLSVQTGKVRKWSMPEDTRVDFRHANWESAIFKDPVNTAVNVTSSAIEGDEQCDLENHGGPDNVVLAYNAAHYAGWREILKMPDIGPGAFGENFTVAGFTDEEVCVGDVWAVGGQLRLQVTQARQPCYKLARRLRQPHIVKMVRETSRGGWYLRVLSPGPAEAGMEIRLLERPHPDWPVARAVQVMYARKHDLATAQQLAQLPELSARWKHELLV